MKSLKTKRIFVLIWVAILICLLTDIYYDIQIFNIYPENKIGFWITIVRSITTLILLIMSINLWQIVKAYTDKSKWKPYFYYKLRRMGFWAVALTLISPTLQMIIFYPQYAMKYTTPQSKLDATFHIGLLTFANSSLMWFLSLSIFLFAELLKTANQFKTENESII